MNKLLIISLFVIFIKSYESTYIVLDKNENINEINNIDYYIRNKYNIITCYIISDYCNITNDNLTKLNLTNYTAIHNNYWIVRYTAYAIGSNQQSNIRYFKIYKDNDQISIIFSIKYKSTFISKFFNCKIYDYEY